MPEFLLEFKKDLQANKDALPRAVVKDKQQFLEELQKICNDFSNRMCNLSTEEEGKHYSYI